MNINDRSGEGVAGFSGAPLPENEEKRLRALHACRILDTAPEQAYDDLAHLAATICDAPIAMITLVDKHRQWFKARVGVENWEDPREVSFCAHAILRPGELLQITDTQTDPRFRDNPLVVGEPKIRFYAGVPLVTREGAAIGTICVIDRRPRTLTPDQEKALHCVARQVVTQLELRESVIELEEQSLTDPLTGLWNRRGFDLRLREEWLRQARLDAPMALLMIEIDHVEARNQSFDELHDGEVLLFVSRLLTRKLRSSDFPTLYGNNEFAVLLPGCNDQGARIAAERARLAVNSAEWQRSPRTVSIGLALGHPSSGEDPNVLIAKADLARHQAKSQGGNQVKVFASWSQE